MGSFSSFRCHSTARLLDRVLDIGSGDNPHPRADVAIDFSLSDEHRWGALRRDHYLVLGDIERLPFRDRAFDVALCFHVLEHVRDPVVAVKEIQRVATRGICEMPSLYGELLFQPFSGHRWVFAREGKGLIYAPNPGNLVSLRTVEATLKLLSGNSLFRAAFLADVHAFRVRLHWSGTFPIRLVTLDEVVFAFAHSIKVERQPGAVAATFRRFGGYLSDVAVSVLRRTFGRLR